MYIWWDIKLKHAAIRNRTIATPTQEKITWLWKVFENVSMLGCSALNQITHCANQCSSNNKPQEYFSHQCSSNNKWHWNFWECGASCKTPYNNFEFLVIGVLGFLEVVIIMFTICLLLDYHLWIGIIDRIFDCKYSCSKKGSVGSKHRKCCYMQT